MRIVTGSAFLLMIAAQPASSSEAFIIQVTNKAVAAEQAAVGSAKSALTSAMLALPVKPGAPGLSVQTAVTVPGANTSSVLQIGSNNVAAVSQSGSGNANAIIQHGSGNQTAVTQHH